MSDHNTPSLSGIAQSLVVNNRALYENSRSFDAMVKQLQNSRNMQQHRDDILNYILNDENNTATKLTHSESSSFTCLKPVFFHIIIETYPLRSRVGRFSVIAQPKSPDGRACKLESGQMVVMHPNFTVAWYIEGYQVEQHTVVYTATSDQAQAIRYFEIRHDWSSVNFRPQV